MIRHLLCALIFTGFAALSVSGSDCNCAIPDTALRVSITWNHWNGSKWNCEDKNVSIYDDKARLVEVLSGCDMDYQISHTIYDYRNGGQIKTTYYQNNDSEFQLNNRSTTYDYPQVDTILIQSPSDNGWVNLNREIITDYHNPSKGLPGEKTGYVWKNNGWVPDADTLYEYNSFDSLTNFTVKKWDDNSSKFVPESQRINTFNSSGLLIEYLYRVADGSTLKDSHKETYSYDSRKKVTEKDYYDWDKAGSSWKSSGRDIYTYNSGSGFEIIIEENRSWSGSAWVTSGKHVDSLDNEGKLLADIIYHNENGQWTLSERYVFSYDCFGNRITSTEQYFTGSDWADLYQTVLTYFYKFSTSSHNSVIALTKSIPRINSKRGTITIENIAGNKEVAAEIFDLRGRMVTSIKTQALQNKITINASEVLATSSPYLIRIKDKGGNIVWKGKIPVIW